MNGFHDSTGKFRRLPEAPLILSVEELKLLDSSQIDDGVPVQTNDGRHFVFRRSSALAADDVFVVAGRYGGRFVLRPGMPFDLALPIAAATADAAVLATVPAGAALLLGRSHWEITENWTGGSSSAIGISSDQAPYNTKGDLLGGAAGDVAATLVASAGRVLGTIGADVAAGILLKGGATIRFDRITSAFTAGSGFAHIVGTCLAMP